MMNGESGSPEFRGKGGARTSHEDVDSTTGGNLASSAADMYDFNIVEKSSPAEISKSKKERDRRIQVFRTDTETGVSLGGIRKSKSMSSSSLRKRPEPLEVESPAAVGTPLRKMSLGSSTITRSPATSPEDGTTFASPGPQPLQKSISFSSLSVVGNSPILQQSLPSGILKNGPKNSPQVLLAVLSLCYIHAVYVFLVLVAVIYIRVTIPRMGSTALKFCALHIAMQGRGDAEDAVSWDQWSRKKTLLQEALQAATHSRQNAEALYQKFAYADAKTAARKGVKSVEQVGDHQILYTTSFEVQNSSRTRKQRHVTKSVFALMVI
jgi:hypothetical protein